MTIEQLERRLRLLEQSTRGLDYVRARDTEDAAEDAENASKKEIVKVDEQNG
jgi:hypothetical protein